MCLSWYTVSMNNKDKRKPGPVAGIPTYKTTVMLEQEIVDWAKEKPEGLSAMMRRLLREEYEKDRQAK